MADFAGDTSSELERKVKALVGVAILETVTYAALLIAMVAVSTVAVRIAGTIHGQAWVLFAIMVVALRRPMQWTWPLVVAFVATGPAGPFVLWWWLRTHPIPHVVSRDPRLIRAAAAR